VPLTPRVCYDREPMDRDLSGRCGSCAFFASTHVDATGTALGDCRLGCWPSPVREASTCGSWAPRGAPTDHLARKVRAPRAAGRRGGFREPPSERPPLPQEIEIDMDQQEFRRVLTEVLREELGVGEVAIGERWQGGEVVLVPGREGTQEKRLPIEAFFKKIVMIRDKLRVLEQKVNASALSETEKVQLQQYVTGCYGSLTTFNVLFRDRDDRFVGAGGTE
jgi:hypothetical protein